MSNRALVRNAADPKQVRYAARKEKQAEERFLDALAAVMNTQAGRIVCATLLQRAGLDRTVFDHSGSIMNFNEGRRNFGLEIKASIIAASESLFEQMEREERARQREADRETDAVHTPSSTGDSE